MDALKLSYKAVSKAGRGVRSLFSKAPKAAETIDRAARLLRRRLPGKVALAAGVGGAAGTISLDFHPWAAAVKITAPADGELGVVLSPAALGPGYVRYVVEALDEILDEIDFVWQQEEGSYAAGRDFAALQRAFTAWLARQLRQILDGEGSKQLAMPQEPRLEVDAPVLTPMGPRSRAWCEAVLGGASGREVWPMWEAATAAALSWACGMWLLWVEVPWRMPMGDNEKGVMKQAHQALAAAYRADKSLAMPWAEWMELVDLLDLDDDVTEEVRNKGVALETARQGQAAKPGEETGEATGAAPAEASEVGAASEASEGVARGDAAGVASASTGGVAARAAAGSGGEGVGDDVREHASEEELAARPIGYRRYPARFELTSGWSVRLPPNFADSWVDEGASMVGSDGDHSIRCSCAESDGDSAGTILAKIPMRGDVLARLDEDGYQGRVEGRDDDVNGVRVVTAIMATEGGAAVISAVLRHGDDEWAIETWRTLRRKASAAT